MRGLVTYITAALWRGSTRTLLRSGTVVCYWSSTALCSGELRCELFILVVSTYRRVLHRSYEAIGVTYGGAEREDGGVKMAEKD